MKMIAAIALAVALAGGIPQGSTGSIASPELGNGGATLMSPCCRQAI